MAGRLVQHALAPALAEGLARLAQALAAAEHAAAAENRQHWEKVAQAHGQNVQALSAMQAGLGRQAELLERAVHASGEIARLEDALTRNLEALAGATNFEQTVLGLAAALHLLNARLTEAPAAAAVQLVPARRAA